MLLQIKLLVLVFCSEGTSHAKTACFVVLWNALHEDVLRILFHKTEILKVCNVGPYRDRNSCPTNGRRLYNS